MMRVFSQVVVVAAAAVFASCAGCTPSYTVRVQNRLDFDRTDEVVAVPAELVKDPARTIVVDADGQQVPFQFTPEGALIFPVDVKALSVAEYAVREGEPERFDTICCGLYRADRMDDFLWENDRSGYRTYGPAAQHAGDRVFGYDVFTKSVSYPVMNERFDKAIYGDLSFHIDHGDGMDSYGVGPTLGCGADAPVNANGRLVYPWGWTSWEILEEGPVRFRARLTYSPVMVDGLEVVETRIITLDRGSWLNQAEIRFNGEGKIRDLAAGVVVHPEHPDAYRFGRSAHGGWLGYADLGDRNIGENGEIYVGAVFNTPLKELSYKPFDTDELAERNGASGHLLGVFDYADTCRYWFGSGWSKGGIKNMDAWETYLAHFAERLRSPLTVTISKK